MSGNGKKEFGDYQTPIDFCYKVCEYIKQQGFSASAKAILDITVPRLIQRIGAKMV